MQYLPTIPCPIYLVRKAIYISINPCLFVYLCTCLRGFSVFTILLASPTKLSAPSIVSYFFGFFYATQNFGSFIVRFLLWNSPWLVKLENRNTQLSIFVALGNRNVVYAWSVSQVWSNIACGYAGRGVSVVTWTGFSQESNTKNRVSLVYTGGTSHVGLGLLNVQFHKMNALP